MQLYTSQMRDTDSVLCRCKKLFLFWEQLIPVQKLNGNLMCKFHHYISLRCTYLSVHRCDVTSHAFRVDGCECSVPKGMYTNDFLFESHVGVYIYGLSNST